MTWLRTWCLAPIWAACLLASDLAPHRVPGSDLAALQAASGSALIWPSKLSTNGLNIRTMLGT